MSESRHLWVVAIWLTVGAIGQLSSGIAPYVDSTVWSGTILSNRTVPLLPVTILLPDPDFMAALWRIVSWDSWMFAHPAGQVIRGLVLLPIGAMYVFGLLKTFGPMLIQMARVVVEAAKGVLSSPLGLAALLGVAVIGGGAAVGRSLLGGS